ncbi:hypothetical protein QFC20_006864 [Naganishia adeliensis]|uniref:Uncharacterized protein n=1 Tax=Naganishia adeliensis TaxID=92952 RepID=A0ACC2V638_9TREE|nr:hypothetical protein QFC20_006864 [Naganishia adeliensis]
MRRNSTSRAAKRSRMSSLLRGVAEQVMAVNEGLYSSIFRGILIGFHFPLLLWFFFREVPSPNFFDPLEGPDAPLSPENESEDQHSEDRERAPAQPSLNRESPAEPTNAASMFGLRGGLPGGDWRTGVVFGQRTQAQYCISPESFESPCSAHTGFARALQRLAKWNWRETPILVPLYTLTSGLTAEVSKRPTFPESAQARAIKAFEDTRKVDRDYLKQTMVIATEEDLLGKAWLRDGQPSKLIASRVVMLAAAASEMLVAGSAAIESLFKTPLQEYDFLLHLKPEVDTQVAYKIFAHADPAIRQAWESHQRNQTVSGMASREPLVEFNPVNLFVQDLERLYGHQIVFFHDKLGGTVVGGLWNPSILQHRSFKPFLGYSTKPVVGDEVKISSMVEANKAGILAEIKRLGEGIVSAVEVIEHE